MSLFLNKIPKPIVGLAPMDGITDHFMRHIYCQTYKPDLTFTEFINVNALVFGQPKVLEKLRFSQLERPIIAQLSGQEDKSFYQAGLMACFLGFNGIDINLGCPARTVVKNGGGAALIEKYKLVEKIIKQAKKAINDYQNGYQLENLKIKEKNKAKIKELMAFSDKNNQPEKNQGQGRKISLSVKTRIGINKPIVKTWIAFLLNQGLNLITLHGRTAKQGYEGQADWKEIKKAVDLKEKNKNKKTLILGNGDIKNQKDIITRVQETKADGVLIGRGALGNPWIFKNINQLKQSQKPDTYKPSKKEKINFLLKHASYLNQNSPDRFISLRKHFGWYCKDFTKAKQLRIKLFQAKNLKQVKAIISSAHSTNLLEPILSIKL